MSVVIRHQLGQDFSKWHLLAFTIVAFFLFWNCFYQLQNMPLMSWDESRHGVSAIEMIKANNYLVNTYNNAVDYYNLKPVLSFYPMVLGYKLFGFNPLGLRFFSALLTVLTVLMVVVVASRNLGYTKGIFAGAILVSVERFFLEHNARSGDPDALYIFLYVGALLLVIGETRSWLRFAFAFLLASAAFLTKSFHVLPLLASLFVLYILKFGQSSQSLVKLLVCLFVFSLPIALWAFSRYQYDRFDFLWQMVSYDLLKRSANVIEGHAGSVWFYLVNMRREFKFWWIALILLFAPIAWSYLKHFWKGVNTRVAPFKAIKLDGWNAQIIVCITINMLMFSLATSKLDWYVYPVVPLIALFLANSIVDLGDKIKNKYNIYSKFIYLFVAFAFVGLQIAITMQIHKNLNKTESIVIKLQELGVQLNNDTEVYVEGRSWSQAERLAAAHSQVLILREGGKSAYETNQSESKVLLLEGSM